MRPKRPWRISKKHLTERAMLMSVI